MFTNKKVKKYIFVISILISIASCQIKSDCFGGRIVIDEIEINGKYKEWKTSLFEEENGTKYIACNFPDTLIKKQNYIVKLKLLKSEPNEKWVEKICEISKIEVQKNQTFDAFEINQETLFIGGGGKTEKGETIVHGLHLEKISDVEIKYQFTELFDWTNRRERNGNAIFQKTLNDKIECENKELESAFRFVDSNNNIEILVTKAFRLNATSSRLIEKDKSKMSGLMYNK